MNFSTLGLAILALGGAAISVWSETPRARIAGEIIGPRTQKPVAKARVVAVDELGRWHRTKTDAFGHFSLRNLPEGRAKFFVQSGRWRFEKTLELRENRVARPDVTLKLLPPNVPPPHPQRDPFAVQKRTREILGSLPNLSPQLLQIIAQNNESGLPLEIVLAQAGAESSFRPHLDGPLDEIGLFQLRPATANELAGRPLSPEELRDAALNTRLATRYLGRLNRYFQNTRTALGAYNLGIGRTQREGLYPIAQIYADAILASAKHPKMRAVLEKEAA